MNFITDTEAKNKEYLAQHPFFQKHHYYVVTKDIPAVQRNSSIKGTIPKGSVLLLSEADSENESMVMVNCEYARAAFSVVYSNSDDYYSIRTDQLEEALADCDTELTTMFKEAKDRAKNLNNESLYGCTNKDYFLVIASFISFLVLLLIGSGFFICSIFFTSLLSENPTVTLIGVVVIVISAIFTVVSWILHNREEKSHYAELKQKIEDNEKSAKQQFEKYICSVTGEN